MVGMGILQAVVALAAWTMVMWVWMYGTRIPAMRAARVNFNELSQESIKLDDVLPRQVQWKAHNYNHLHEAPTVFYAIAIVLAIIGQGDGYNLWLGWLYVAMRVVHSLVQATANPIVLRFAIFAVSSLVLAVLIVRAALVVF